MKIIFTFLAAGFLIPAMSMVLTCWDKYRLRDKRTYGDRRQQDISVEVDRRIKNRRTDSVSAYKRSFK